MTISNSIDHKTNFHAAMRKYAGLKRFFERWSADPGFRESLLQNMDDTLEKYYISVNKEDIRAFLTGNAFGQITEPVRKMWEISQSKQKWVDSFYLHECLPNDPGMLAWRKRQIARQKFDLGPFFAETNNIHSSLAIELSQGCSVGCWFCALSPDSFKEYYNYQSHKTEWAAFLSAMHQLLGPGIKSTFLYWATEPFDNPDYESFCLDVYDECGVFPPTTTAVAHKYPERIRKLIELSAEHGCWLNRLSLTSLGIMTKVHKEFSDEELAEVECLALNMNASFAFGNSGDFRKQVMKKPEILTEQDSKIRKAPWHKLNPDYAESEDYANGSICCVTGFLVNMVSKRIQLISPTTASDEWPLGYIIHFEEKFDSIEHLYEILEKVRSTHFKERLNETDQIKFHPWLNINIAGDFVEICGKFKQKEHIPKPENQEMCAIVQLISESPDSLQQIKNKAFQYFSIDADHSNTLIHQLFNKGYLYGH